MKEGVEEYFSASSVVAAIKKLLDNFSLFNFFVADLVKNFKYYQDCFPYILLTMRWEYYLM